RVRVRERDPLREAPPIDGAARWPVIGSDRHGAQRLRDLAGCGCQQAPRPAASQPAALAEEQTTMSNTYEITPAQIAALSALYREFQAGITDQGRPPLVGHSRWCSAADLGASGAALAALARKGMAEQDSTLSRLW